MKFQYYSNNASKPEPLGFITLSQFLDKIKNPNKETKELLLKIQQANDNLELKAKLKTQLYAFTPSATFKTRRAYCDIINFTGLAVLDFDKIDYVKEFKEHLFYTYRSIIATWISPSQKGIKALVKIPVVKTIDQFKEYFYGIASEMQIYKGFDGTTQNASLLLFIGYDKDILIRNDYTEWTIKGIKQNEFSKSKILPMPNLQPTDAQSRWVFDWYKDTINGITDNGHPQLRDNSVTFGGFVGGGYLSYIEAINLMEYLVTTNGYLQKDINNYIKTATQSINLGMTKPLTFSK